MAAAAAIDIGIIGGVGQRLELADATELEIRTPYGETSTPGHRRARSAASASRT